MKRLNCKNGEKVAQAQYDHRLIMGIKTQS